MNLPTYPKKFPDDEHHLLFDIGFSSAMLYRFQMILEELLPTVTDPAMRAEITNLLQTMRAFQEGRLQNVESIYKSAPGAVAIGHN
ncbi:MAG TPA: hypothetical protein VFP71_03045 [Candidatus Angelobacter sp.]|nr:hypothetical protein [Candidatus Angelobacter sp.]